jgi:hypothetical protein
MPEENEEEENFSEGSFEEDEFNKIQMQKEDKIETKKFIFSCIGIGLKNSARIEI